MNALVEPPEMGSGNYRIAMVLREDLEPWQRLNVTAFTVSGVAAAAGVVGQPYRDGSGLDYLPMFKEPALIFGANAEQLRRTADRARTRDVRFTLFTDPLFKTFNDHDSRVAVASVFTENQSIAGMAFRCERKVADKILNGLKPPCVTLVVASEFS